MINNKLSPTLEKLSLAFIGAILALIINYFTQNEIRTPVFFKETDGGAQIQNVGQFGDLPNFVEAAERSVHAVVHVKTRYESDDTQRQLLDLLFGDLSDGSKQQITQASGSGVIVSSDGYIVTNLHVIDKSSRIEVVLNDKRTFDAKIIGTDPSTDIALLKVDATQLPFLTYGNSDELRVGEWVLAVGNPFNLTSTVTAGIVSAKARNINAVSSKYAIESFIQTDAAVNPGNSGGALVNQNGDLVGINTAIATKTGYFTGYSFAVPVSMVKKIVADIIEYGTVQRAVLGVNIVDIDAELAKEKSIDVMEGVYVAGLTEEGAAKDAGMEEGDIILKVNDIKVNNISELQEQINKYSPGDKVNITVKRNKEDVLVTTILKNKYGSIRIHNSSKPVLGAVFEELSESDLTKLKIAHGVKVIELNAGKMLKAGIQEGFVITFINREAVRKSQDVQDIISSSQGGIYIEGVNPDGSKGYYAFGMK